jgi:CRP-like cAMP-binding protein
MDDWQKKLIDIFRSKSDLNEEACDKLISLWKKRILLKRNEFLVRKGQLETQLFYVLNGSMRLYFPNKEEKVCVGFAYDHNLICSYPSFIRQEPSDYYIQALSKTELMAISRQDFYNLFDQYPK